MSFKSYNANPDDNHTGDCTVRAICTVLGEEYDRVFVGLCVKALEMHRMPEDNVVWGAYLYDHGWRRGALRDKCPACYTVRDFCREYPKGRYIMAISGHVVAVIDGDYYDTWDSGEESPVYYWEEEKTDGME